MKRILLSLSVAAISQFAVSQVAFTEDFTTLTVGNIGTDITGTVPGQNMWLTTANNGTAPTTTTNADNTNFQVVETVDNGNALQLTGPNGDKGTRIITQAGLAEFWNTERESANNILEIEYDLYTGATSTSRNNMRLLVYDPTNTKILAGLSFVMDTKVLSGVANYDATAQGGQVANYLFYLGTPVNNVPQNIVLPAETWVRIGMSYNYTTGEVKWKGPGFNGNVTGAAPMNVPTAANIMATSGSNANATPPIINSAAGVALYDNIVVRASATDTLLGVAEVTSNGFAMFPNPATNEVRFSGAETLGVISISDINGRVVKSANANGALEANVDVSGLSTGMYIVNIVSGGNTITKKLVKN